MTRRPGRQSLGVGRPVRVLAFLVLALALAVAAPGAAAVRVGATECTVDLTDVSGSFVCTLALGDGLLNLRGSLAPTVDVRGGAVARFRYDSGGRLVEADVDGEVTSYSYDAMGRLAVRVGADGQESRYTYDPLGRLVSAGDWVLAYSDLGLVRASSPTDGVIEYTYDADRHVLSVSQAGTAERFAYDASGRIAHADGSAGTIEYQYDGGELVRRVDDGAVTTEFSYDQRGRLVQSAVVRGDTTRFKYDKGESLLRVADENGTTRLSYDKSGHVSAIIGPGGGVTSFGYDTEGHLSFVLPAPGDDVVVAFEEGDPDSPIIIGVIYTQGRSPPWSITPAGALRTCGRCP